MTVLLRLAILSLVACGAQPAAVKPAPVGDDITLYRDAAVIRQRVEIDVPATSATLAVRIAAGVAPAHVMVIDRGQLTITALHGKVDPGAETTVGDSPAIAIDDADDDVDDPLDAMDDEDALDHDEDGERAAVPARVPAAGAAGAPTELRLEVAAPRPGRYAIVLGYITDRLPWHVAYTITANPERDLGLLSGALAIRNETGITLRAVNARLIDAELGTWRARSAEQLAAALVGATEPTPAPAPPRALGPLVLERGETRVELVAPSLRPMRSVLVYDPIGTKLDNTSGHPLRDARLGVETPPSPRVSESFEVARDAVASAGLPAGPVRLLERRANGSLVLLGESRMFEATARVAQVDTIAIGTAEGVTGTRERRELTVDDENRRIVEEFVITLDNQRPRPASVLVREHLYRGQTWTLAYHSAAAAAKEGAQQIALRAEVPARSQLKILYVVVYTWGP